MSKDVLSRLTGWVARKPGREATDSESGVEAAYSELDAVAATLNRASVDLDRLHRELGLRTSELSEAHQQQATTAAALKAVSHSTSDLETVLATLAESGAKLINCPLAAIYLRDGEMLRSRAVFGTRPKGDLDQPLAIDRMTIAGRVMLSRQPEFVPDTRAEPAYDRARPAMWSKAGAVMAVPLLRQGRVEGAFAVGRPEPGGFTVRQSELLQSLADQAVIAVENARLTEEVKARNRERAASGEVLRVISRFPTDVQPVFDAIAQSVHRLCNALYSTVIHFDGSHLHFVACEGLDRKAADLFRRAFPMKPGRDSAAARAVLSGAVEQIPDVGVDREYVLTGLSKMVNTGSVVAVPMMHDKTPIGAIVIDRAEKGYLPERQVELLQTFADQAVIAIENVRLFKEVERHSEDLSEALRQQTATADVLKIISRSTFDLPVILKTLTASAAKLCGVKYGGIYLREGDHLCGGAVVGGTEEDEADHLNQLLALDRRTVSGRVALSGHVEQIPDLQTDAEYDVAFAGTFSNIRALMGVPLLREGRVEGAFYLGRSEPGPFTERQCELVQTFADQAVIAIANVRLFEQVQARTRELQLTLDHQTATGEVLRAIAASPADIQPVLGTVVESAAKLCEAYDAAIFLADGDFLALRAHHGPIPIDFAKWPVGRDWVTGRAFVDRKPVHVHDLPEEADEFPAGHAMAARLGFRTILAVPLLRKDEAIGGLMIRRQEVRPFSRKLIELLTTFADQAVIAIENVRLFEEVQARNRDLTEALEQQAATAEILRTISTAPTEVQPVFEAIVRNAVSLCGSLFANAFRFDGELLHWVASHNVGPSYTELLKAKYPMQPDLSQVSGRVLITRSVVRLEDALADADYDRRFPQAMGWRRMLGMPLLREGDPLGVIVVGWAEPGPISTAEEELLKTFADQAVIAIENARLFEEVQARNRDLTEALEQQTATSEILRVISSSPTDMQPVFDVLAENATRLCSAQLSAVFRFDGELVHAMAFSGLSSETIAMARRVFPKPPDRGGAGMRAILSGAVEEIPDTSDDADYARGVFANDVKASVLAVPMLRDGAAIGAIAVERLQTGKFPKRQINLLKTFADQAVIAIENVRLFDEVKMRTHELSEALQQQTATANVLKAISRSTFDLPVVLKTLSASAVKLCGAAYGGIVLRRGDLLHIGAAYGGTAEDEAELMDQPLTIDRRTVSGRVAMSGHVEHIPDILADPEYNDSYAPLTGKFSATRALMGVPLLHEGRVVGAFFLGGSEPGAFSGRQNEIVQTFADQAVIAIRNVRLFEEVQARTAELARSVGELKALGEVSQAVNSTLDLKTVLETIVAKAVQLSGSDAGAIYVYSKSADRFRLRATYGMSAELIEAISGQAIGLNDAGIGEAARLREPVQSDLGEGPVSALQKIVLDGGFRSVLVVPLLRPSKVIGALVVRRRTSGRFSDPTVHLLETFAAQSVLAIQNARLFSEIEENGRQLEIASRHKSQFLANMSHELRTPLNSVLGFTEMLADGLYGELPAKALATLARVQANGRHLLGLINDVLDLSKIEAGQLTLTIDDYSIGLIVRTVVATTEPLARAKGLKLSATVAEGLPMGRGDERRLSQVLLNLAGNAVKFAEQGSIDISADARNGKFEVLVRDTGPGIAPEHQKRIFEEFQQVDESSTRQKGGTGLGLAISKRIVEMHGGTIGLESELGKGSTFRVAIPVSAGEQVNAP
ncbi:MAG: GAF domain-containing protein [Pseudomonadota bacterium]|nr:GAF domain-containing protein [Pseudomonadota bacterium]